MIEVNSCAELVFFGKRFLVSGLLSLLEIESMRAFSVNSDFLNFQKHRRA